jgi:cytochrome c-type biogenesis protein CcmF
MTVPIGLSLLFLMAVAPVLPWRKASTEVLSQRLFWPAWAGVGTVVLAVALGARGLAPLVAFGLGGFAAGSALRQVVLATRRQGWRGLVGRTNGGMVVHIGVVLVAVGLAASGSYATERELTMAVGDTAVVAGHEIGYEGTTTVEQSNKTSIRAQVSVDGDVHEPAINRFPASGQSIGTPSVATSFTRDVYLTLLRTPDDDAGQTVAIRVIVQPLVAWLWIGGIVMVVGTSLAAFPGRRRNPTDPVSAPVGDGRSSTSGGTAAGRPGLGGDGAGGNGRGGEPAPVPAGTPPGGERPEPAEVGP